MRLKPGVVLSLGAPMARVLSLIDSTYEKVTGLEMVITSGSDGVHMTGSRHYTGEAIDLRIMALDVKDKIRLRSALASVLGVNFDVVLEMDHLHIEYDPY